MEHLLGVTAEVTSLLSILAAVGSPLEPGFWNGMSWHVWGVVVYNCITHVDRQGGNLEIIGTNTGTTSRVYSRHLSHFFAIVKIW